MIAAQILEPKVGKVAEVAAPTLSPQDILIDVKNAGVCGTDMHIWHGSYALAQYPLVPGHEFSGVVAAVGGEVAGFKPGERVTADPNLPCYRCYFCQRRQFNQCLDLSVVGVTRPGAFAGQVVVPQSAVYPIGDLSFAEAALLEPLACVAWGLKQVQIQAGDRLIIFGMGPMGLLMLQAAKHAGAALVAVVDKEQARLDLAEQLGADVSFRADGFSPELTKSFAPYGFDVAADATGVPKVIESLPHYAASGGKLWVFGVAPSEARASYSPYDVFRRDLKIIGSFALNKTFHEAIAMVQGGVVKLGKLVSHSLPITDFETGLDIAERDPKRLKVQFELS